jgi:serine phosphatase RsbU (regulator of sigma subunit)
MRIANTLQEALLPESLPQLPDAEVHARYSAAGALNEVGGDFYDVIEYSEGSWMLVIGDVCGKGPRAAGVTALARHTLRAAAMSDQTPRQMLNTLHQALRRQPSGADLCTVCLVSLALTGGQARLTVTLAGHPRPLLVSADGKAEAIGRPGTLLGIITPIVVEECEHELLAGQTLLLYTDGVTDAGQSQAKLGERGLRQLASLAPRLTLEGLLRHIEQSVLAHAGGSTRDDIALLALRLRKR